MENLEELSKKYPNDMDFGRVVRQLKPSDQAIELLKEIIALHGFGGYGYENALLERGKTHYMDEDGKPLVYRHSIDANKMNEVDDKIIAYLKSLK
jgi:hypothetical protein